jgi:hypothetical protein
VKEEIFVDAGIAPETIEFDPMATKTKEASAKSKDDKDEDYATMNDTI